MRFLCLALLAFAVGGASVSSAQAPLLGGLGGPVDYGTNCLYRNDDGSSSVVDLTPAFPAGLRFFTETHTQAYVNTNGNITFSGSLGTYTPRSFPIAEQPMIAPYWADVDIRTPDGSGLFGCTSGTSGVCDSTGDNSVWWHLEPGRMIVTWYDTGYFACHTDKRMSFQLILTAVPGCGGSMGDFDVEFRYNRCEWETGDASSGTDGFGGTEAQAGFDAGNETDYVAIAGSLMPGIASHLCTNSNVGEPGVWRFQVRSGTVICPDAGARCNTGEVGVCAEGVTQCVAMGTECLPVVPSGPERCDALDNDCDGATDEGGDLCPVGDVCDRGSCIAPCFEGSCSEGFRCNEDFVCVSEGCDGVECPEGLRCRLGECVNACEGVICPGDQACRGGRCVDLCGDLTCDPECTVCSRGECITRCDLPGGECAAGEMCTSDGLCVATECVGVTCDPGFVCRQGSGCIDACEGTVCPEGDTCSMGYCSGGDPVPRPDAGPIDPGAVPDSGLFDSGLFDAGRTVGRSDDGCGCTVPGRGSDQRAWILLIGAAVAIRRRRTRRRHPRRG